MAGTQEIQWHPSPETVVAVAVAVAAPLLALRAQQPYALAREEKAAWAALLSFTMSIRHTLAYPALA